MYYYTIIQLCEILWGLGDLKAKHVYRFEIKV